MRTSWFLPAQRISRVFDDVFLLNTVQFLGKKNAFFKVKRHFARGANFAHNTDIEYMILTLSPLFDF